MKKSVSIIGSGFSSLAAASYLASAGLSVTVFEKNSQFGGRARQFKKDGYLFDMGPSWYWMPDVFEKFFNHFDKKVSDYYELEKLSTAYNVYFGVEDKIAIPSSPEKIIDLFEKEEAGSGEQLKKFLAHAKSNYDIAVKDLVYRPGVSPLELVTLKTIPKLNQLFFDIRKLIARSFKSDRLKKILEFPVLFLGAKPGNTPAMYSFMNWADFGLGTWHPKGGMYKIVEGMLSLAKELGVDFVSNANVDEILTDDTGKAIGVKINGEEKLSDVVLSGADYHHTETLLPQKLRQYSEAYWDKRVFAPSSLLFYVGFSEKIKNVEHHNLFFDEEFDAHAEYIYDEPAWPKDPLFYANFPSATDASFAPENCEAAMFLIPIAPGLNDTEELRKQYFDIVIKRTEKITNQSLADKIEFMESYCVNDFIEDYNSYKGNAYGMANILTQTAFLRPKIKSKKVKNLFFTGQLTVPGPGVPPALISGKIAAEAILKELKLS